jgi:phosphoribosylformylglycinamidine synthase
MGDASAILEQLLALPNIASKAAIFQQYDQIVGGGTVIRPGADAGVVRLPGSQRAIAASLDGSGRRTWLDPRRGGRQAVAEAARNVACTGGRPLAITNCLNFGNPEKGETPYGWPDPTVADRRLRRPDRGRREEHRRGAAERCLDRPAR